MRYKFKVTGHIEPHLINEFREYIDEHFYFIESWVDTECHGGLCSASFEFGVPEELEDEATSLMYLFEKAEWEETDLYNLEMYDRMGQYL